MSTALKSPSIFEGAFYIYIYIFSNKKGYPNQALFKEPNSDSLQFFWVRVKYGTNIKMENSPMCSKFQYPPQFIPLLVTGSKNKETAISCCLFIFS